MKFLKNSVLFVFLLTISSLFVFAQNTGSAKGKVRTSRGDAISGATITAKKEGEDVKSVKTDAKGNFQLNGLKPGLYNFVFEKNGYATGVKYNVEIKKDKEANLGDRLILTVDKGTQVIINGSVYNQAGFGIYGAKIEIEKILEDGKTRKVSSGYSGEFGEFTFRFPEGAARFRITASAKGASASKEIEVSTAAIYRVAITLNLEK
jgi:hypothetical protein